MSKAPDYIDIPLTADEDLTGDEGKAVYPKGSPIELALADDGADQAATQALPTMGTVVAGAASASRATGQRTRPVMAVAGAGGVAVGDYVVAEYNTGKYITYDPTVSDLGVVNYIAGQALTAASANGYFQLDQDARCADSVGGSLLRASAAQSGTEIDMDDAAATLTAAQCLDGLINVDPNSAGATETLTTDTAANLIAGGVVTAAMQVRKSILINTGDEHITLAAGSGVDLTNAGADLVIEDGEVAELTFVYKGAASVALLITKAN